MYYIGIAVDTPAGWWCRWSRTPTARASSDLAGGTFTISGQGGIGGTGITPIVNAPEVAILGVVGPR